MYQPDGAPCVPFPVDTCPSPHLLHAVVHSNGFGHLLFVGSSDCLKEEREREGEGQKGMEREGERENDGSPSEGEGRGNRSSCGGVYGRLSCTSRQLAGRSATRVDGGGGGVMQEGSFHEGHTDSGSQEAQGATAAAAAAPAGVEARAGVAAVTAATATAAVVAVEGPRSMEALTDASAAPPFISGSQVMELWDALCSILRVR